MKKKKTVITLGAAAALTLAAGPAFSAASNPFRIQTLRNGYLVAQAETQPKGTETKPKEGHCGSKKDKDGHCGAMKGSDTTKSGDTQGGDKKVKDAKCGEGTCGANKKKTSM